MQGRLYFDISDLAQYTPTNLINGTHLENMTGTIGFSHRSDAMLLSRFPTAGAGDGIIPLHPRINGPKTPPFSTMKPGNSQYPVQVQDEIMLSMMETLPSSDQPK